jgi:hypothetical protein
MCVQNEEDAAEKAAVTQSAKPVDSQPVQQPMQQPAVNQAQQTANSAVGLYGIPVPVAQPTADDQAVVTPTTVLPPATSNNSMDSVCRIKSSCEAILCDGKSVPMLSNDGIVSFETQPDSVYTFVF